MECLQDYQPGKKMKIRKICLYDQYFFRIISSEQIFTSYLTAIKQVFFLVGRTIIFNSRFVLNKTTVKFPHHLRHNTHPVPNPKTISPHPPTASCTKATIFNCISGAFEGRCCTMVPMLGTHILKQIKQLPKQPSNLIWTNRITERMQRGPLGAGRISLTSECATEGHPVSTSPRYNPERGLCTNRPENVTCGGGWERNLPLSVSSGWMLLLGVDSE